jgi:hypothetical protein
MQCYRFTGILFVSPLLNSSLWIARRGWHNEEVSFLPDASLSLWAPWAETNLSEVIWFQHPQSGRSLFHHKIMHVKHPVGVERHKRKT